MCSTLLPWATTQARGPLHPQASDAAPPVGEDADVRHRRRQGGADSAEGDGRGAAGDTRRRPELSGVDSEAASFVCASASDTSSPVVLTRRSVSRPRCVDSGDDGSSAMQPHRRVLLPSYRGSYDTVAYENSSVSAESHV